MSVPANFRMVNYRPAAYAGVANAGVEMWANYDGPTWSTDFAAIAALGFNVPRIGMAATTGAFDWPTPNAGELANLVDMISRANAARLQPRLLLYDFQSAMGEIAAAQTFAQAVNGALQSSQSGIHSLEVRNEVPFEYSVTPGSNTYTGAYDSGWPAGTPEYTTEGQVETVFVQQMIPYLRTLFSPVPITVSVTASYGAGYYPLKELQAGVAALSGSQSPDWWELHYYPAGATKTLNASDLDFALEGAKALVGGVDNLFIGEFAADSSILGLNAQADWVTRVRAGCAVAGVPDPSPWMFYDGSATYGGVTGLYTDSGTIKPAGTIYQKFPAGSPQLGVPGRMTALI